MIAIGIPETTYLNPVPIAASDPVQVEIEENEEGSSFAELLAGLLSETSLQKQNTRTSEVSKDGLETLAVEKSEDGNKLNFFVETPNVTKAVNTEDASKEQTLVPEFRDFDIDLSDESIDKVYQLINKEYLSNISMDEMIEPQELDAKTLKRLADLAVKADFSSFAKTTETISEAQLENISNLVKEVPNEGKNQSSLSESVSKNVKTESVVDNTLTLNNNQGNSSSQKNYDDLPGNSRSNKISFDVRDLRTKQSLQSNLQTQTSALAENSSNKQEVTLDLKLPDYGQALQKNISQAQTSWEVKASTAIENMLARELHQNFNGDIVRHASMAIRDGGEGTIKIALHPEHLGNVKILLKMAENKITGHIFVESQEALNAFRKEITALEQAFKDSGYADANLDLSFTADGFGQANRELEQSSIMQQMAASSYEDSYESETAPIVDVFFGHRTGLINMLA